MARPDDDTVVDLLGFFLTRILPSSTAPVSLVTFILRFRRGACGNPDFLRIGSGEAEGEVRGDSGSSLLNDFKNIDSSSSGEEVYSDDRVCGGEGS